MTAHIAAKPTAFAAAKVNLFLHVGDLQADGFHPLSSLMVFADVGDRLTLEPAATLELVIDGPFATGLSAGEDNLVLKAARAVLAGAGMSSAPLRIRLDKQLPVAAGLGGGSSDAGAALRLLRDALDLGLSDEALTQIAADLGSDGAACLFGEPVMAEGRGERLSPPQALPVLTAVLVNPMVASPTGAVYRAFDAWPGRTNAQRPADPPPLSSARAAAAWLSAQRNDLETPAAGLVPEIARTLTVLRRQDETLLARVSGSGATCFALCEGQDEAERLAARIRAVEPGWWVRPCRLGGPWTEVRGA